MTVFCKELLLKVPERKSDTYGVSKLEKPLFLTHKKEGRGFAEISTNLSSTINMTTLYEYTLVTSWLDLTITVPAQG